MDPADLPLLSLAAPPQALTRALAESFSAWGFALITDHGIDAALIAEGWRLTAEIFAQPLAEKLRGHRPALAGARGYTPFGREQAKAAPLPDLKEFWHVGREPGPGGTNLLPANIWPRRPAGCAAVFTRLFAEFDRVGAVLLARIAVHLGLDPGFFAEASRSGNSVLRLLHYPPVTGPATHALRASAHEDINLITLLLGAEEAGLELRVSGGGWHAITPPPGALVVNIGDMLQRLTNRLLPSTTHRVRNPGADHAARSRYAMPFFLHPPPDFPLAVLPQCVSAAHPNRYPGALTADGFLQQRLEEIGLKAK
ncbi:MAG: isopenicillin N synthase family oxygenase [Sphingomonadales bacterium]|nr:isopenicillin N synthase family oxygenase [Sphingomonadales bacterium]